MKDKAFSLNKDQIEFACGVVANYLRVCQNNGCDINGDMAENSSLLRRMLGGKQPLPSPPPKRFGIQAYELVEGSDEIQIEQLEEYGESVSVDKHDGYEWKDKEAGLLVYRRLGTEYQVSRREIVPDSDCVGEGEDPDNFKYTATFLRRVQQ